MSDVLSDLQISQGPLLSLESDWKERFEAAKLTGVDYFLSSSNLYRFLDMLIQLVARPVCARTRDWHSQFSLT